MNKLKEIFEQKNKDKEELKLKIQTIFNKLRNALKEKEVKLLLGVEEYYNNIYLKEDIIKESENLSNKIKQSLEKGKIIDKEWKEDYLSLLLSDCINIENNIKEINIINDNIKKCYLNKVKKIDYNIEEENINNIIDIIQNFGKIITEDDLNNDNKIEMKNPIYENKEIYDNELKEKNKKIEELNELLKSKDNLINNQNIDIKKYQDKIGEFKKIKDELELSLNTNLYNFKMKEYEIDNLFQVFEAILSKKKDKYQLGLSKLSKETKESFQLLNKKYKIFK